jgi:hypothetical protein
MSSDVQQDVTDTCTLGAQGSRAIDSEQYRIPGTGFPAPTGFPAGGIQISLQKLLS